MPWHSLSAMPQGQESEPLRVAVVGGGLVGPVLALILQREGGDAVEVTVLERDSGAWTRDQGTALDFGMKAKRVFARAGVREGLRQASRKGSDCLRVVGKKGGELAVLQMPRTLQWFLTQAEEVNRNEMRDNLLAGLADGALRWGHSFIGMECVTNVKGVPRMRVCLDTADGEVWEEFDAVIGADGSNSGVRPFLVDDAGHDPFSGYACVQGFILEPEASAPAAHQLLGEGSMMVLAGGCMVWLQRYASDPADHRICFYFSLPCQTTADLRERIGGSDELSVRRFVTTLTSGDEWHVAFKQLAAAADWFVLRNIYHYPEEPTFKPSSKRMPATLCGDALHAMVPYQGAGANVGIEDTGDLATAVLSCIHITDTGERQDALVRALRRAEKTMLLRSAEEARESMEAGRGYHLDDAHEAAAMFRSPLFVALKLALTVDGACHSPAVWVVMLSIASALAFVLT